MTHINAYFILKYFAYQCFSSQTYRLSISSTILYSLTLQMYKKNVKKKILSTSPKTLSISSKTISIWLM